MIPPTTAVSQTSLRMHRDSVTRRAKNDRRLHKHDGSGNGYREGGLHESRQWPRWFARSLGTVAKDTVNNATRAGTLQILQSAAGVMKISDGSASYEVRLDGADHPQSDDVHSTRSMKLIDEYTLEETDKTEGKVSGGARWTISKNGKSMRVESSSTKRGQTMKYTAEKQPTILFREDGENQNKNRPL